MRNPDNPTEFLGVDTLNNIRVVCHELSHNFGLPDLYDYDRKLDTTTYYKPIFNNFKFKLLIHNYVCNQKFLFVLFRN